MSKGVKDTGRVLFLVFGSMLVIASVAGCIFMFKLLLTPWWIPVSICIIFCVALGLPLRRLWRGLTKSDNLALQMCVNLVFLLPLALCTVLTINYATSGRQERDENAIVRRVYWETHYKTKRVSRRVYTRGAPYKVYYISIELADGHKRDVQVLKKTYDRLVKGDTIGVHLSKGALGMKVFNGTDFILPPKAEKKSRSERIREKYRDRMRRKYREHQKQIFGHGNKSKKSDNEEND